jgi:hypothetical protein
MLRAKKDRARVAVAKTALVQAPKSKESLAVLKIPLARSSHHADRAPKASVRDAEEGGADRGKREELRPGNIQPSSPK